MVQTSQTFAAGVLVRHKRRPRVLPEQVCADGGAHARAGGSEGACPLLCYERQSEHVPLLIFSLSAGVFFCDLLTCINHAGRTQHSYVRLLPALSWMLTRSVVVADAVPRCV